MKISLYKISFPGNSEADIGAEKSNNLLQNMSNGYVYPSAYTYNGGISYPYNIDQNTKEQMEAYNKLMLASYQNGQQFYSNSQYPSLSPTQQQVFTGTMNSSANTQNTEDTRSTIEGGNDNSKKHEEAIANPHNSSFSGAPAESQSLIPPSTMLPSPTCNVSNTQDSSNSSITTPSSNQCQPSPQAPTNISQQLSPTNVQQYSPTNSFSNWPTNSFSYTAENPYTAFYNNPNMAAAMYNQSMNMGVNPQAYFSGTNQQQQPDSTTSANMNRGWGQHPTNTPNTYPFHPAAFVSPYSDPTTAAALYSNYASLWNHNTNQYIYGSALQQQQANQNNFMNNFNADKMKETCDKQMLSQLPQTSQHQLKSFYNESQQTQSQHPYDKSQLATSTTLHDQNNHGINSANNFTSLTSSPNQSIDLELTYRNNPELAEKLRQVSLKKPRVTFSIKQVVELEKEFHSSR